MFSSVFDLRNIAKNKLFGFLHATYTVHAMYTSIFWFFYNKYS